MAYSEIEIKFLIDNLHEVEARLKTADARLVAPRVYERNVRYENADKTLREQKKVVRLRQDTRVRLTFKDEGGGRLASGAFSRFEAEVEVSDFDAMNVILERLGYFPHMIYEKYRTTYTLEGAEVVLDEMPYGHFVEIEGEETAIQKVMQILGLNETSAMQGGYAVLFENVKRSLGLHFQDLTFANFEGISVPANAFKFG